MDISTEAKLEVSRLLQQGQKLEAIKYLRDAFDISLQDAKTLVEAAEREMTSSSAMELPLAATNTDSNLRGKVIDYLKAGKKLEAVKFVKSELNIGLAEAARFVDNIDKETNPDYKPPGRGCGCLGRSLMAIFGTVAIILFAIAGAIYYFESKTIENGDRVTGLVVDFNNNEGSVAPVIEYEWRGAKKLYYSNIYSTPPAYVLNEEVPMVINRDDPDDILLDTFTDRWLAIVVLCGLGAIFGFFSLLFRFLGRKF